MILLSSCHHCSLNNDCHCHWHSSCLALPCLALPWCEWTSITIVIIGMTLYELVLHYHIILYLITCFFILFLLLIRSPILLYFKSIWLDSILFYWIRFTVLFSIVSHINEWFVSICPSVCSSVCLSVWISSCFHFSFFSVSPFSHFLFLFFLFSFFFFFCFLFYSFFTLFSHERLPHTHTRTRTHTYIWIYVPSYDSYILLQQNVSEESYSSDSIISYLI